MRVARPESLASRASLSPGRSGVNFHSRNTGRILFLRTAEAEGARHWTGFEAAGLGRGLWNLPCCGAAAGGAARRLDRLGPPEAGPRGGKGAGRSWKQIEM